MAEETQGAVEMMMEKVTKATQTILAIGIAVAAFVLFYALILKDMTGSAAKDVVLFVLGCVSSNLTQIISYYFGSSKSSEDKNKALANLTNSSNTNNQEG